MITTNRFYATRASYQIPATIIAGGGSITVGRGVDMTDPQYPLMVPDVHRFFEAPTLMATAEEEASRYKVSGDSIKDSFALLQTDSQRSEAAALNTYFRASYALTSIDAAMEMASSSQAGSHSAYVLLTHRGDSRVMSPELMRVPEDLQPVAESIEDDEAAFTQFRRDFGTHYIHAITYGLTIAIRGSLRSASDEAKMKLGTRLKASFQAVSGEGGVDAETKKQVSSGDLDLTTEVNCGGTEPPRPLSMSRFEEISSFLQDIHEGKVTFILAPVEVHLASYWNLLDPARLPRCRSLLDPVVKFVPSRGAFGVPAGTIVAWRPTTTQIENPDDPAKATIRTPEGWALCDGQDGRPDLRGRFIRGTGELSEVGEIGGSEKFTPKLTTHSKKVVVHKLLGEGISALDSVTAPVQNVLPPFLELVYIIKLDETH